MSMCAHVSVVGERERDREREREREREKENPPQWVTTGLRESKAHNQVHILKKKKKDIDCPWSPWTTPSLCPLTIS